MPPAGVRVPCTFPGCPRVFPDDKAMRKHKAVAPEHEYCDRCDEDFEDENRLLIHKIKSERHIACPLCGLDFRSEGGRDAHVRQYHRADQNMVCVGCGVKYTRAAGLMAHVEDGECPVITPKRLLQEQAKKLIVSVALKSGTGGGAGGGAASPLTVDPSDPDDRGGGVRVDEALNREALANQPRPDVNSKSRSWKPSVPPSTVFSLKHWPRLGDGTASQPEAEDLMAFDDDAEPDPEPSDLMAFSTLSITERKPVDRKLVDKHWPKLGTQPAEATAPARPSGDRAGFGRLPDTGEIIKAFLPHWDATRYFNSFTGLYDCPCGGTFTRMKDLEEHVMEKARHKQYFRCPACHRVFKTGAALVAHCESATTRCAISESDDYARIIDELTGGVVQYAGYNRDGTARYEAGRIIALPEKTTTTEEEEEEEEAEDKERNTTW
ncbi:hypothetical protein VTN02DRAFT_261 [Thermoascus thermophilus]